MQTMYYIGLDVQKRTISYCVKDGSGEESERTCTRAPPKRAGRALGLLTKNHRGSRITGQVVSTRQRSAFTLYRLRLAVREFVLDRWPLLVNPLKDECGIINCPVHEISLRHVRFCSGSMSMSFRAAKIVAANRIANFLSSVTRDLLHCGVKFRREKREPQSTFSGPTSP